MCFSNLPIEFDEEGNPHLAPEADEVDRRPGSGCGCGTGTVDVALGEADPEAMVDEILETMPDDVRDRLADGDEIHGERSAEPDDAHHGNQAEGD